MELKNVVPWGRSFSEYKDMFTLTEDDLNKKILGCGDGPACFNAEMTERGHKVVSVDPIYKFNVAQIKSRITSVYPNIINQISRHQEDYLWDNIANPAELGQIRMEAMNKFLGDFEIGKEASRYVDASLPTLPFDDNSFNLALCSHYLFLYSDHIDLEKHIEYVDELCRVSKEVRVYPLLSLEGTTSRHLETVVSTLSDQGLFAFLAPVKYEFQKGADQMLVVKKRN